MHRFRISSLGVGLIGGIIFAVFLGAGMHFRNSFVKHRAAIAELRKDPDEGRSILDEVAKEFGLSEHEREWPPEAFQVARRRLGEHNAEVLRKFVEAINQAEAHKAEMKRVGVMSKVCDYLSLAGLLTFFVGFYRFVASKLRSTLRRS